MEFCFAYQPKKDIKCVVVAQANLQTN